MFQPERHIVRIRRLHLFWRLMVVRTVRFLFDRRSNSQREALEHGTAREDGIHRLLSAREYACDPPCEPDLCRRQGARVPDLDAR